MTIEVRKILRGGRRLLVRAAHGFCWLFAPVATSVKGALDRNDFRPVLAKVFVMATAAGAGVRAALKDPDVMGAVAIVLIAVLSGIFEAVSRANQHTTTAPPIDSSPTEHPKTGEPPPDAKRDP